MSMYNNCIIEGMYEISITITYGHNVMFYKMKAEYLNTLYKGFFHQEDEKKLNKNDHAVAPLNKADL